jgi:hypothetical protein
MDIELSQAAKIQVRIHGTAYSKLASFYAVRALPEVELTKTLRGSDAAVIETATVKRKDR